MLPSPFVKEGSGSLRRDVLLSQVDLSDGHNPLLEVMLTRLRQKAV